MLTTFEFSLKDNIELENVSLFPFWYDGYVYHAFENWPSWEPPGWPSSPPKLVNSSWFALELGKKLFWLVDIWPNSFISGFSSSSSTHCAVDPVSIVSSLSLRNHVVNVLSLRNGLATVKFQNSGLLFFFRQILLS